MFVDFGKSLSRYIKWYRYLQMDICQYFQVILMEIKHGLWYDTNQNGTNNRVVSGTAGRPAVSQHKRCRFNPDLLVWNLQVLPVTMWGSPICSSFLHTPKDVWGCRFKWTSVNCPNCIGILFLGNTMDVNYFSWQVVIAAFKFICFHRSGCWRESLICMDFWE